MLNSLGVDNVSQQKVGNKNKIVRVSIIQAVTCDFQQYDTLTSVDSDEPVQPAFKLRISKCC